MSLLVSLTAILSATQGTAREYHGTAMFSLSVKDENGNILPGAAVWHKLVLPGQNASQLQWQPVKNIHERGSGNRTIGPRFVDGTNFSSEHMLVSPLPNMKYNDVELWIRVTKAGYREEVIQHRTNVRSHGSSRSRFNVILKQAGSYGGSPRRPHGGYTKVDNTVRRGTVKLEITVPKKPARKRPRDISIQLGGVYRTKILGARPGFTHEDTIRDVPFGRHLLHVRFGHTYLPEKEEGKVSQYVTVDEATERVAVTVP